MTAGLVFRDAQPGDEPLIAHAVRGIASAEGLLHKVIATEDDYTRLMFTENAPLHGIIAERAGLPVGVALWHAIVTTYRGLAGVYLEDVFVEESCRGQGIGRAIFAEMAKRVTQGGYDRLQWSVKNDNIPAVAFYERIGADRVSGFTTHILSGEALAAMARC